MGSVAGAICFLHCPQPALTTLIQLQPMLHLLLRLRPVVGWAGRRSRRPWVLHPGALGISFPTPQQPPTSQTRKVASLSAHPQIWA